MRARPGLRAQFVAVMVVASLSFGFSVLAFLQVLVAEELQESSRQSYVHLIEALSTEITTLLLTQRSFDIQILLSETASQDVRLAYLVVTGPSGRIVASSYGTRIPTDMERIVAAADRGPSQGLLLEDRGRPILHLRTGLLGGQAGFLHAGIDQSSMHAGARRITVHLAALFLVLTFAGVALAFAVGRMLTEPLRDMAAQARRVGAGDLTGRLAVEGNDEVAELAAAFNDMTSQLDASHQALLRTERLAAVGRLAAGVAHEINNPLASLRAGLWALRKPDLSPTARQRYLEALDDGLKRIAATVQGMLSYARPRPMKREPVLLEDLAERSASLVGPSIPRERVSLVVESAPGLPVIAVDRDQMEQVLVNLILNAVHAMDAASSRGRIWVRVCEEAGGQVIEVADDGPGISPEHFDRVFEPFFTTRTDGHGTGLGLPLSQGIVEAHGGTLTLGSGPAGHGVIARVFLPGTLIPAGQDRSPAPSSSSIGASG